MMTPRLLRLSRTSLLLCGAAALVSLCRSVLADPASGSQPTFQAEQFTDFVGINGTPQDAAALGIRHYRAVLKYDLTPPDQPARFGTLYDQYGVQAMMLLDPGKSGTPQDIVSLLKQYKPGVIAQLEGPSEVNNKFPPQNLNLKYKGQTDEAAGAAYMNDLYPIVKADPVTKAIQVVSYTAIFTDYHLARPCASFDFANMHSYQGYNVPSSSLLDDETSFNNILPIGTTIKPFVPTECGYNVEADVSNGSFQTGSLRAQALNIPMLFAEYFRHGIPRTYLFAVNNEDGYGLQETDPTQKRPSFYAVKNLLAAVKDATWNPQTHRWEGGDFTPKALLFTLENAPPTVHALVLQKKSGQYQFLLWNEVTNFDPNAHKDIVNAPIPVTLRLQTPVQAAATVLTQNASGGYDTQAATVSGGTLALNVPASVMIVRLRALPRPVARPADFSPRAVAGSASPGSVSLTWQPPQSGTAAGYFVFRNGAFLTATHTLSYEDASAYLRPGLGYTYAVQGYDKNGTMSPRVSVVVQTPNKRPDLVCTNVVSLPAKAGDLVTFQATLRNIGDGPTPPETTPSLTFFVDGQYTSYALTNTTPLAPGEARVMQANGGATGGKWTAVAGAHILHVQVDDTDRVSDESRKDNNNVDRSLLVDVQTPGLILGAADPAPDQVNLTAEGTEDWIHWGLGGKMGLNRKAAGGQKISDQTKIGSGYQDATPGFGMSVKWSDGAPTAKVDDSHASLWHNGVGSGYSITAPADTQERVLRVYVGGINGAACTLTASLSDGSAPDYVSKTFNGNLGPASVPVPDGFTTMYTLRYRAASANQKLTVTWTLTGEPNQFAAQSRLQAATLTRAAPR